jgi:hypothetical protein
MATHPAALRACSGDVRQLGRFSRPRRGEAADPETLLPNQTTRPVSAAHSDNHRMAQRLNHQYWSESREYVTSVVPENSTTLIGPDDLVSDPSLPMQRTSDSPLHPNSRRVRGPAEGRRQVRRGRGSAETRSRPCSPQPTPCRSTRCPRLLAKESRRELAETERHSRTRRRGR